MADGGEGTTNTLMADRNRENDRELEHLNQPITDEYPSPHLWDKREAKHL